MRLRVLAIAVAGLCGVANGSPTAASAAPPAPSASECRDVRASTRLPVVESFSDRPGGPRVFAMQFKQELRHVATYASFRTKIECSIREYVLPRLAKDRPNVVAFNEDVGLMTIATGSRGALARALFGRPGELSCEPAGVPCTTIGALAIALVAYTRQNLAYKQRFGFATPLSDAFVAATDTFVRGWMQVFSDMARRYGVYIFGSNNQAPFRESADPADIETFRDPDLPRPRSVFVATSDAVYNEAFMWAPRDARRDGPEVMRNVVLRNKKVPVTPIEETIEIANGPRSGPAAVENLRPYRIPGTDARVQFATSLPAFVFGDPPPAGDPCADTARFYMRCMDKLGVNLVLQDEANPGRWPADGGGGYWQPLEWMRSTWRQVADPTVGFAYNVTPHMVGNLADLAFDGQTAITQRGLGAGVRGARRCTYVGNTWVPAEDPAREFGYAGPKREFLAVVPWVVGDRSRSALREVGARLAPGSGDRLENDYVETAVVGRPAVPARSPARCVRRRRCSAGGGDDEALAGGAGWVQGSGAVPGPDRVALPRDASRRGREAATEPGAAGRALRGCPDAARAQAAGAPRTARPHHGPPARRGPRLHAERRLRRAARRGRGAPPLRPRRAPKRAARGANLGGGWTLSLYTRQSPTTPTTESRFRPSAAAPWVAGLWGLIDDRPYLVEVTVAGQGVCNRNGLIVHRARSLDGHITTKRSIPTATPARTVIDLAARSDQRETERLIDATDRLNRCTEADLLAAAVGIPGHRGAAKVIRTLREHAAGDTVTVNDFEELFLKICDDHGIPRPIVNRRLGDYVPDFRWPEHKLIAETDGYASHTTRRAFEADREREGALVLDGWRVLRFTWRQLTERPEWVASRVMAALESRP